MGKMVKMPFAVSRKSEMPRREGGPIHFYEVYTQYGVGVSIGISGVRNADNLADAICQAWNEYIEREDPSASS